MICFIPLSGGKAFAKIDLDDLHKVVNYKWQISSMGYAQTNIGRRAVGHPPRGSIGMHRLITDAPKGSEVDHINHDKHDNRRCNLRVCSKSENMRNMKKPLAGKTLSKYKGVTKVNRKKSKLVWLAQVNENRKHIILGQFENEEDAATAYNFWAHKTYGSFVNYNSVPQPWLEGAEV